MKNFNRQLVLDIGTDLRKRLQDWSARVDSYAIDSVSLAGACGIASYISTRVLRSVGIQSELRYADYGWGGHCWATFPDSDLVFDVTATQFQRDTPVKIPDVVLAPAWEYPNIYRRGTFRDHRATVSYLHDWDIQGPHYPEYSDSLRTIRQDMMNKFAGRWSLRRWIA